MIFYYLIYLSLRGDWGLGIGDWGLGIGGWGWGLGGRAPPPKPQTPNPQSPIPISKY